jgi:general secretion pathway protein I
MSQRKASIRAAERQFGRGFTLLEAMVALVIVSLGMMAVNSQLNRYVVAAVFVEQKTLASWIATNMLTELSVADTWPEVGDYDEDVEFAGQQWRCAIVVEETPVENLRRVDVSVSLQADPERVVHKVTGLIEPPAPAGFLTPQWSSPPGGRIGEGGGRGPGDVRDSPERDRDTDPEDPEGRD